MLATTCQLENENGEHLGAQRWSFLQLSKRHRTAPFFQRAWGSCGSRRGKKLAP